MNQFRRNERFAATQCQVKLMRQLSIFAFDERQDCVRSFQRKLNIIDVQLTSNIIIQAQLKLLQLFFN